MGVTKPCLGYEQNGHSPKSWLSVIADEYLPIVEAEWIKLTVAKVPVSYEIRLKKSWEGRDPITGEIIRGGTYIISAAVPQDINGKLYITGCNTDISQQKWIEEQQRWQRDEAVDMKRQQEK